MDSCSHPVRGRPRGRKSEKLKRVYLKESSYALWNQRKDEMGIRRLSNSEFAEMLLHQQGMEMSEAQDQSDNLTIKKSQHKIPFTSTPSKQDRIKHLPSIHPSRIIEIDEDEVDVTGVTASSIGSRSLSMTTYMQSINPYYSSIPGNPFEEDSESDESSEGSKDSDEESYDDSATLTAMDLDMMVETEASESNESSDGSKDNDEEGYDDSTTLTAMDLDMMVEPETTSTTDCTSTQPTTTEEIISSCDTSESVVYGPLPFGVYKEQVKEKLKETFTKLKQVPSTLERYQKLAEKEMVVVEVQLIESLVEERCAHESCVEKRKIIEKKSDGGVLTITYTCSQGHFGIWHSSSVLCEKKNQKVFVNPVLMAAPIILSGNNFEKMSLLAKCMNLQFISQATFSRLQSLYIIPSIKEQWEKMKEKLWDIYKVEMLLLCGDGRMDSPGFCAKYCMYTMMDHFMDVIVDVEIVDKREAGGTSTLMETIGCKRILERMFGVLNCCELVTDASSTIMKMVRELQARNPQKLGHIFHSLDIWHKSCKLTAKISKAAKKNGCQQLKEWTQPVRNHFWHCAQQCEGDVTQLKNAWIGIIHHVCGEHEWEEGECSHGPLTQQEADKRTLAKNSKAAEELRKIVFDPKWMKSLQYYVNFRHTSNLENFHSMMLKYVPKRVAFSYEVFVGRSILAALDHNFHLFRDVKEKYHKLYSKRSGNWRADPIKEVKDYKHLPVILADVFHKRTEDTKPVIRRIEISPANPKNLAPTIALRASPATSDLIQNRISRKKHEQPTKIPNPK